MKITTRQADLDAKIPGSVAGFVLLFALGLVVYLLLRRRSHNRPKEESMTPEKEHLKENDVETIELMRLERSAVQETVDYIIVLQDWEISPNSLVVMDINLGEGQFGIVKQGVWTHPASGKPEDVAVKMLRENHRESELSSILSEIKILKKANNKRHPNVIKFIGGCFFEGKLLVVTEFCFHGNLKKFLIKSRVSSDSEILTPIYANIKSTLDHRELLRIARDVANGMAHLSANKFVHRDLAARNILINKQKVAKIADFGLARDIGSAEEYIRTHQNLLPVKWMALESLLHGCFTTASDVWSFGVLLYEITTLGGEPYENISPYNVIVCIGSGFRMSKPAHCSSEIYKIMRDCWEENPQCRPTFPKILKELRGMLTDNENLYINVTHVEDNV
ncbi:proto-oncogene tyrosine-protein kinase receptor Ret-like [Dendronephthya gigantea]|uniref:proto-oncogene tyrosine-protein kinase receptor Ret-like n=1 Tax=Dendronephthya gigantea TaxID=151771 RepID=UPI00106B3307|nr:proto-oncogene tyrosine-protein kinase receptor Ret-like [Dendronephthya gigantea]